MRIKITQCLEDGAKLYTANFKKLVLASLVSVYLMLVSGLLLAGVAMIGMLMLIAAFDNDEDVSNGIPYIFKGFKYFIPSFLIYISILIITFAIIYLGYLLKLEFLNVVAFIVAFAIGIGVMYSFFFIYEKDMNFIDASKSSFNLVRKDVLGSFLILVLVKIIAGSFLLWHAISAKKYNDMFVPAIAMMVFMMPLAMCIYYKGYKMLAASVADEDTAESEAEEFVSEAAKNIEEESEYFAKEDVKNLENSEKEAEKKAEKEADKKAEKKVVDVLEPEILAPENDEAK